MIRWWFGLLFIIMVMGVSAKTVDRPNKPSESVNCQKDPTNPKCMKVWDILQSLS